MIARPGIEVPDHRGRVGLGQAGRVTLNVAVAKYKRHHFDPGSDVRLPGGPIGAYASQTVLSGSSVNDLVSAGQARNFDLVGTATYQETNYSGPNIFGP